MAASRCEAATPLRMTHAFPGHIHTSDRARNRAALFSRLNPSARTVGFTPAFSKAARSSFGSYCALRLFERVFRFCPKDNLRKLIKAASGTRKLSSLDAILSRTTVDSTLGGGENEDGGRVNNSSTRA